MNASDWLLLVATMAMTSWIGHRLSGKQATIRDFFLGGRKLPWYAVAGSIIATEISAVTLIGLPATVAGPGGNLTYLQLGLVGSLIARSLVAWILVPAYFEREIYSPYDYIGARLGESVRRTVTILFSVGGVLGQAARVYLTALVLELMLARELAWLHASTGISPLVACIGVLGIVAIGWTWMGGMATVIWTDLILFGIFLLAIGLSLVTVLGIVEGGAGTVIEQARAAGKLRLFDLSTDPKQAYTLWAAIFAGGIGGLGAYGTDQLMAQRIFCCANVREARKAIVCSYGAMFVTVLVGCVGLALYAYYQQQPLQGADLEAVQAKSDRLFVVFIASVFESPWKGLIIAGVLAAAISSLDSILAALSQTTLALTKSIWSVGGARALKFSRALVLAYGLILCVIALFCDQLAQRYGGVLNLALAMPLYTQGAVLGAFFIAFYKLAVRPHAYHTAAIVSVATTVVLQWPGRASLRMVVLIAAGVCALGLVDLVRLGWRAWFHPPRLLARAALVLGPLGLLAWVAQRLPPGQAAVSWVWNGLIGCAVTLGLASLWSRIGPAPERG